jgi:hypothetical protein
LYPASGAIDPERDEEFFVECRIAPVRIDSGVFLFVKTISRKSSHSLPFFFV